MAKYVFLSFDIHRLGGGQTYLNTKVDYLKKKGYDVYVFSKGKKFLKVPYTNLKKYDRMSIYDLNYPPMVLKNSRIKKIINKIKKIVKPSDERIIIESCDDVTALWGEIIAKLLNFKHFCFSLNELFMGKNKHYKENLGFFEYKYKKNELAFISSDCIDSLFGDSFKFIDKEKHVLMAYSEAVEDIDSKATNIIKNRDINIAYIGRYSKSYVKNILNDIVSFCKKYCNKTIGFTLVGDAIDHKKDVLFLFRNLKNVTIFFTGVLIPIPQKIFSRFDVIIAGAGCARFSYYYSKYVIIPDAKNGMCNGLLGYDTMNRLFHEDVLLQTNFCESLEKVLIKRFYDDRDREKIVIEDLSSYYDKHFEFINSSSNDEYYDIKNYHKMKKSFKVYLKCILLDYLYIFNPILYKLKKLIRRK